MMLKTDNAPNTFERNIALMGALRLRWHAGDVIRKLRDGQGWSQGTLAERAGTHLSSVRRAEENKNQETVTVESIAGAFGVSWSDVLASVPIPPDETSTVVTQPSEKQDGQSAHTSHLNSQEIAGVPEEDVRFPGYMKTLEAALRNAPAERRGDFVEAVLDLSSDWRREAREHKAEKERKVSGK